MKGVGREGYAYGEIPNRTLIVHTSMFEFMPIQEKNVLVFNCSSLNLSTSNLIKMESIKPTESLHDQILEYTGKDLLIGTGSGLSIDDPVILLAHENYGYTECNIISFYLRKYETVAWDVIAQEILVIVDKQIEYIKISVSESPDDMKDAWVLKYYFDVTDCINLNKNYLSF